MKFLPPLCRTICISFQYMFNVCNAPVWYRSCKQAIVIIITTIIKQASKQLANKSSWNLSTMKCVVCAQIYLAIFFFVYQCLMKMLFLLCRKGQFPSTYCQKYRFFFAHDACTQHWSIYESFIDFNENAR